MGLLDNKVQVLDIRDVLIGEFDPKAEGFYRNVLTYSLDVKKKRVLYIDVISELPVDVAVANEKGASVFHKQAVKEGRLGPVPTGDSKEMGLFLGVYPGDKTAASVQVWMERE